MDTLTDRTQEKMILMLERECFPQGLSESGQIRLLQIENEELREALEESLKR